MNDIMILINELEENKWLLRDSEYLSIKNLLDGALKDFRSNNLASGRLKKSEALELIGGKF